MPRREGDLDKNGKEDVVLELVEEQPKGAAEDEVSERSRALVALLSEGGKLRRAGASNKVLYCTACQGTLGTGEGGVTKVEKGVLLVDQMSGSREMVHTVLRFRYDAKERQFVFIGEDVEHCGPGGGHLDGGEHQPAHRREDHRAAPVRPEEGQGDSSSPRRRARWRCASATWRTRTSPRTEAAQARAGALRAGPVRLVRQVGAARPGRTRPLSAAAASP